MAKAKAKPIVSCDVLRDALISLSREANHAAFHAGCLNIDKGKDAEETLVITDWKLDKVERKEEGKIDAFGAFFLSEEAKKHTWGPESDITVRVNSGTDEVTYEFKYTTVSVKQGILDYITKAFSGHKNEWYDYLKVWDNTVDFDRIYSDGSRESEKTE